VKLEDERINMEFLTQDNKTNIRDLAHVNKLVCAGENLQSEISAKPLNIYPCGPI
jgi:hypothetical protein